MIDVDHVDRLDRGVGVGVGREQGPASHREQVHRLLQELDAVHPRHPVVGQQHGHAVTAQQQFVQRLEGFGAGVGPHDAIVRPVAATKVAGNGAGNRGVVVDREKDGFAHQQTS